ncbi:phenoloxidase-activating factor 2 isoform X2 [Drosophila virilis]|uniref:phenoloxidase-activating factor 2 isoform X2 n=1 Tax=Drosophila virilis TaxID=7244 RepID=UPI00139605AF|nr:phenoloxidase-activating factor 2 isoform X1 [Drosophila virilis]
MWRVWCLIFILFLQTHQNAAAQESPCGPERRCIFRSYCVKETVSIYARAEIDFRASETCPHNLQVCCKLENIQVPVPAPNPKFECGVRNIEGKPVPIVKSREEETDFPEFPWVVAIFLNASTEQKFIGGGSILAPNVVLTAAHIVYTRRTQDLVARAGEWDIHSEIEPLRHKNCLVLETICHEQFHTGTAIYDIALLILRTPLELTHHIMPVCLPRSLEFLNFERCFVAGWGKPSFEQVASMRNVLRKVDLPIVNRTECQQRLRSTRLGRYFELHESFICAGGERGLDACTGDGGSPLFCPLLDHPNQYFQLGIVAWGLGCHTEDVPGVYANVFQLQKWLRKNLKDLDVNPNYFTPTFTTEYFDRQMHSKNLTKL